MQDLVRTRSGTGRNGPRNFWNWLERQPWRKMLPRLLEHPGTYDMCVAVCCNVIYSMTHIRLKVPSIVPSEGQHSPGRQVDEGPVLHWLLAHFFAIRGVAWQWLGSRVLHAGGVVCVCVGWELKLGFCSSTRFGSIYHYDKKLFAERFLGPPGVTRLKCLESKFL